MISKKPKDTINDIDNIYLSGDAICKLLNCSYPYIGTLVKDGRIERISKGVYALSSIPSYIESLRKARREPTQAKEQIDTLKVRKMELECLKLKIDLADTVEAIRAEARAELMQVLAMQMNVIRSAMREYSTTKEGREAIGAIQEALADWRAKQGFTTIIDGLESHIEGD